MTATATLIVGIVRDVMTWPTYELRSSSAEAFRSSRVRPVPHSSRKGWVASADCYPRNPFMLRRGSRDMWTTRDGAARCRCARSRGARRDCSGTPSARWAIRSRSSSSPRSCADVRRRCSSCTTGPRPTRTSAGCARGTTCSRSRSCRARATSACISHAIARRRVRMEGSWHRPVGVRGWTHVVLRRERDGRATSARSTSCSRISTRGIAPPIAGARSDDARWRSCASTSARALDERRIEPQDTGERRRRIDEPGEGLLRPDSVGRRTSSRPGCTRPLKTPLQPFARSRRRRKRHLRLPGVNERGIVIELLRRDPHSQRPRHPRERTCWIPSSIATRAAIRPVRRARAFLPARSDRQRLLRRRARRGRSGPWTLWTAACPARRPGSSARRHDCSARARARRRSCSRTGTSITSARCTRSRTVGRARVRAPLELPYLTGRRRIRRRSTGGRRGDERDVGALPEAPIDLGRHARDAAGRRQRPRRAGLAVDSDARPFAGPRLAPARLRPHRRRRRRVHHHEAGVARRRAHAGARSTARRCTSRRTGTTRAGRDKHIADYAPSAGHHRTRAPLRGERLQEGLHQLSTHFDVRARPSRGRYRDRPAITDASGVVDVPPPQVERRRSRWPASRSAR